jgi:Zn-dependent M16 (insulinase) family peptidase
MVEADFSDQRRIRDLLLETKNDLDASLAPSGHSYAATRAGRYFSRTQSIDELWHGLSQIEFIHRIVSFEIAEISRTLTRIRDTLVSKAGLIVNITGSKETLSAALGSIGERFRRFGPPRSRNACSVQAEPFFALLGNSEASPQKQEVYASPSLQVGFAGMTLKAAPFASLEHAVEIVLAHQLSTGALWEDIRMKGGAYGAFAHPADAIERVFSFSTYRDPNPLRSLETFSSILKGMVSQKGDAEFLEKAVIGAYSKETRPRTAAEKGIVDFLRFLYGIEDQHRSKKLRDMIGVSLEAIAQTAQRLASEETSQVILAGSGIAEKAGAKLGLTVKKLPV